MTIFVAWNWFLTINITITSESLIVFVKIFNYVDEFEGMFLMLHYFIHAGQLISYVDYWPLWWLSFG